MHTHCVIGSGPAGVAAASALLARGMNILMLDAGIELEPDRAKIVAALAKTKLSDWPPARGPAVSSFCIADGMGRMRRILAFPQGGGLEKGIAELADAFSAGKGILNLERATGIEPAWPAWKAGTLPLSYARLRVVLILRNLRPGASLKDELGWVGKD